MSVAIGHIGRIAQREGGSDCSFLSSGLQNWNSMAQDPTMFEFCALVSTEESATDFSRQRGSVLSHRGRVETEILRKMRGKSLNLSPGHLAEYWWKRMREDRPFNHMFTEIARQFPLVQAILVTFF